MLQYTDVSVPLDSGLLISQPGRQPGQPGLAACLVARRVGGCYRRVRCVHRPCTLCESVKNSSVIR